MKQIGLANTFRCQGRNLYRQACARSPELNSRFVFMTGDSPTDPLDLDDSNGARVLSKPFDRAALRAAIDDVLCRLPPRTAT